MNSKFHMHVRNVIAMIGTHKMMFNNIYPAFIISKHWRINAAQFTQESLFRSIIIQAAKCILLHLKLLVVLDYPTSLVYEFITAYVSADLSLHLRFLLPHAVDAGCQLDRRE